MKPRKLYTVDGVIRKQEKEIKESKMGTKTKIKKLQDRWIQAAQRLTQMQDEIIMMKANFTAEETLTLTTAFDRAFGATNDFKAKMKNTMIRLND